MCMHVSVCMRFIPCVISGTYCYVVCKGSIVLCASIVRGHRAPLSQRFGVQGGVFVTLPDRFDQTARAALDNNGACLYVVLAV